MPIVLLVKQLAPGERHEKSKLNEVLRDHGAEQVLCLPFNDALRSLTGRQFIDQVLIQGLNVRHLVVGDDFRFGCDRQGDFELLEAVGSHHGFGVENTHTFTVAGERVSSTRVRTLLASGNFEVAAQYAWQQKLIPRELKIDDLFNDVTRSLE